MTKRQTEETINQAGRSTYPDEKSVLRTEATRQGQGLLLQIFTENMVGPCFFEIIQRKGNEGFGEGNFKALFESLELDQIRRGVLSVEARGTSEGERFSPDGEKAR